MSAPAGAGLPNAPTGAGLANAPAGELLAIAGLRFDLAFHADRVQKVLDARELGERRAEVVDLFALIGEGTRDGGRVVVVARGADELLVRAPGEIAVVTPRALMGLPALVTRGAPFLLAVAYRDGDGAGDGDAGGDGDSDGDRNADRPLFLVDPALVTAFLAQDRQNRR